MVGMKSIQRDRARRRFSAFTIGNIHIGRCSQVLVIGEEKFLLPNFRKRQQAESISTGIVRLKSSTVYVPSTRSLLHNVSWSR